MAELVIPEALVDQARVERFLKQKPDSHTELLTDLINAATLRCEIETSRKLAARDYTALNPSGNPAGEKWLVLPHRPINVVTQVRSFSADLSSSSIVSASDYKIFADEGMLLLLGSALTWSGGWSDRWRVEVDCNAGVGYNASPPTPLAAPFDKFDREKVPQDLALACLEVVGFWFKKVDAQNWITQTRFLEGRSFAFRDEPIPPTAKRILRQHVRKM